MCKFKSVLWLVLSLLFVQTSFSQTITIEKNSMHLKKTKLIFSNNSKGNNNTRKFSVVKISNDCIILKLENSDGNCGDETQIQIERNLKFSNHSFRLWIKPKTENVTEKQFIEHSTLVLNQDPFEDGLDGLKGYIQLEIRMETTYKYKLPKTKDFDYFTYAANFEYE